MSHSVLGEACQTLVALLLPWVPAGSGAACSGLVCPFPWVADSNLTESDTDTKQLRGAGDVGEVRAEKLRKSSEVEAERINT